MRPEVDSGSDIKLVRFGPFQFDIETGELHRDNFRLKLSGHALQLLRLLVAKSGQIVTREELQGQLWPNAEFGDFEHGLNAAVGHLRETLLDSAEKPKYIETVPRQGYRFIGLLRKQGDQAPPALSAVLPFPATTAEAAIDTDSDAATPSIFARHSRSSSRAFFFTMIALTVVASMLAVWSWNRWASKSKANSTFIHPQQNAFPQTSNPLGVGGTMNPSAHEAFLRARFFFYMLDRESYQRGLQLANEAVRLDPNFAAAYSLRGRMLLQCAGYTWMNPEEAQKNAHLDAVKALELDPNSADAYLLLSLTQPQNRFSCKKAAAHVHQALRAAPDDPDILHHAALFEMCLGKPVDAIDLLKRELTLDPLRSVEHMALAQMLLAVGNTSEAEDSIRRAFDLNPNGIMIHETWGEILLAQGRTRAALEEMKLEPEGIYHDLGMALAFHAMADESNSEIALQRLIFRHGMEGAYQIAQVYAYHGKTDQAFAWLDRGYTQADPGLMWLKTDPKMKRLRQDPRYLALLSNLDLLD